MSVKALPFLFAMVCAGGCGGGGPVNFSVDGERPLSSLTDAEIDKTCYELKLGMSTYFSADEICTMAGLAMRELSKKDASYCEQFREACLAYPIDYYDSMSCDLKDEDLSSCSATVAELEACANDQLKASKSMAAGLTCSSSLQSYENVAPPASCQALQATCPGVSVF
jgi:hypothetical protein